MSILVSLSALLGHAASTGSFISPSVLEHLSEPMPPWWWHHPIFKRIERLAGGSAGLLCKHRAYSDLQHPEPITAAGMN